MGRGQFTQYDGPRAAPANNPAESAFQAGLLASRDKIAQSTDASVAFITMKKHASLIGAAKGLGTKALNVAKQNPGMAGAAIGAAGGAVAGGKDHRLGGAAVGAGLGAAAGHGGSKMMASRAATHAAEDKALAGEVRKLNPMGGGATARGTPAPAPVQHQPIPQSAAGVKNQQAFQSHMSATMAGKAPPPSMRSAQMPSGPAQTMTVANRPMPQAAPTVAASGLGGQSPAALQAARSELRAGGGKPMYGVGQAPGTGPAPGYVKPPMAQTQVMQKMASLPPFLVAADPSNAAFSGGSSALVKRANALSEVLLQASEHPQGAGRFKIPTSSIIGVIDDMAMVGRQKLQAQLNTRQQREKRASPYDDTPLFDMKQRAADKYPERVSPIEAIRTDFKKALHLIADKVHDLRSGRTEITQPKVAMQAVLQHEIPLNAGEFRAHREKIASEVGLDMKEMAALGGMPKQVMTPRGATTAGLGALIGGGLGYLGSRGRAEHGGRSNAEVELDKAKAKQPAQSSGIGSAIRKHVVNIHADVAEQMRKHPAAATMTGAGVGAALALRIGSALGK